MPLDPGQVAVDPGAAAPVADHPRRARLQGEGVEVGGPACGRRVPAGGAEGEPDVVASLVGLAVRVAVVGLGVLPVGEDHLGDA